MSEETSQVASQEPQDIHFRKRKKKRKHAKKFSESTQTNEDIVLNDINTNSTCTNSSENKNENKSENVKNKVGTKHWQSRKPILENKNNYDSDDDNEKDKIMFEKDLLYDETMDDNDETFVNKALKTNETDCTLCCPQCFTIVAYCCTKDPKDDIFTATEAFGIKISALPNRNSEQYNVFCANCDTKLGIREPNDKALKNENDEKEIANQNQCKNENGKDNKNDNKNDNNNNEGEKPIAGSFIWKMIADLDTINDIDNLKFNGTNEQLTNQIELDTQNGLANMMNVDNNDLKHSCYNEDDDSDSDIDTTNDMVNKNTNSCNDEKLMQYVNDNSDKSAKYFYRFTQVFPGLV